MKTNNLLPIAVNLAGVLILLSIAGQALSWVALFFDHPWHIHTQLATVALVCIALVFMVLVYVMERAR